MTKKQFKHHMGLICEKRDGEYYSFTVKEVCDLLNALHEENQRLKKAEILANYRGEMVGFATALLDDLGSQTMREMWSEFREEKYREWRELD